MAVHARELPDIVDPHRPRVRLVPPPPPQGRRVAAAVVLFALLAATLGYPVARAALEPRPQAATWSFRPPAAESLAALGSVTPMPASSWPKSADPATGMLFVRCTRLWQARADGSGARKLLTFPGISSPAYSPAARTIAFLVTTPDRQDLWMAAADGTDPTNMGTVVDFADTNARATALTWSPEGSEIAFATVSPGEDLRAGGSVIWTLDLASGDFERVSGGWPAPFYVNGRLVFSGFEHPLQFGTEDGKRLAAQLSGQGTDLAAALVPGPLFPVYDRKAAVLTAGPEGVELRLRSRYWARGQRVPAPTTHRYPEHARPVLSSGGDKLVIELVDAGGQEDIGIYDMRTSTWTVLDYGWEPATSPVPGVSGPLAAAFATSAVERLLGTWSGAPRRARLLAGGRLERAVVPIQRLSYTLQRPRRHGQGWTVPAFVYGRTEGRLLFRSVDFEVGARGGRLVMAPRPTSDVVRLRGPGDAAAALDRMLAAEVVAPTDFPEGARLARYALSAWHNQGYLYMRVPPGGGGGDGHTLQFSYGNVGFYGGCGGGSGKPRAVTVGDEPGLLDRIGGTSQVIWPATSGRRKDARFSVYGDLPTDQVLEAAESIESQR